LSPLGRPVSLGGGVANRGQVFRLGAAVRRPVTPHSPATHALLRHLSRAGFDGAPRLLSADDRMEMLSWIPGVAARNPLPGWSLSDASLVSVAVLVRRFHDAVRGFDGGPHHWPRPVPPAYSDGLVGHNDLHPGNIVFDGERAVGLIDFDLAGPSGVVWDLATVARCWCPLVADADLPDGFVQGPERRYDRLVMLLDAYGLNRAGRVAVAESLVDNHDWTYRIVTDAARAGHPGFREYWAGVAARTSRARQWAVDHQAELIKAVRR